MTTVLEDVLEIIGQGLDDLGLNNESSQESKNVNKFLNLAQDSYVVVEWPESQELMEYEWFQEECILDVDSKFGGSAYFVPLRRIMEL